MGKWKPKLRHGTTRTCLLWGNLCFKFPAFSSWEHFLLGILGNLKEKQFEVCLREIVPPIYFSLKGLVNITARAHVQSCDENNPDRFKYLHEYQSMIKGTEFNDIRGVLENLVELKIDSIGFWNGKIVVVDYGS